MLLTKVGRHAVLLALLAAAHASASSRGGVRGLRLKGAEPRRATPPRTLQAYDCSKHSNGGSCPNGAGDPCQWVGGSGCVPAPATAQPTAPPTASPFASPTQQPTTSDPTASPTASPSGSPTQELAGAGTCSDTGSACFATSECACAAPAARRLETCTATKRNDCFAISGCEWVDKACVPAGPSATDPPSASPTTGPTQAQQTTPPSGSPTRGPSTSPTTQPTDAPTGSPTPCACLGLGPTTTPTPPPTVSPSTAPSKSPSKSPTMPPTSAPSTPPTSNPTLSPSQGPSKSPSGSPTTQPTDQPSTPPTANPTLSPSQGPSKSPSSSPTKQPSASPSTPPTSNPTLSPSKGPSKSPSSSPTKQPTDPPSAPPTANPTLSPSRAPSKPPSSSPTKQPSASPSTQPTTGPTGSPSSGPSKSPSAPPTTANPTASPSIRPTSPPSKSPTNSPSQNPTTLSPVGGVINGQIDVPILPDPSQTLTVALPPSSVGKLITLSQVSADNDDAVPVARSYDGKDFETLHPLLLPVTCVAGSCSVDIPPYADQATVAMHYILREFNPQAKSATHDFARLLLQATYGPTQTSLDEAINLGSAAEWVQDQMSKPASLLREHYRRRANAHTRNDLHQWGTRLACEPGSRWNRAAFNRWRDVGSTIVEEDTGTGTWKLKVNGVVRTEVDTPPSAVVGVTEYVVCNIREDVNGTALGYMRMSDFVEAPTGEKGTLIVAPTSDDCNATLATYTAVDMPAVNFAVSTGIPTANLQDMSDPNILDTKILESLASPTTCGDFKMTWPNFVRDDATGVYYVEDRRVELYDATDGATTAKKRMLDGRCPQVPKTFLNEDTCVVRTDCAPSLFAGEFELNAANLRKFYEEDNKYVYRIENLPLLDTPSPCNTKKDHRFVRKDAGGDSGGCSDDSSGLFPEIASEIVGVLNATDWAGSPVLSPSERQSKRVVDVLNKQISCTDTLDEAIGADFTVTIPGTSDLSCWTHTYPREWSVFVFNDWVVNHPGNPSFYRESNQNPIAKVAEQEDTGNDEDHVFLRFPPMSFHQANFANNYWRFERDLVGSWGDVISFNDLPDTAKSDTVIASLGGTVVSSTYQPIEVCGSPGEVANDPSLGHQYLLQKAGEADEETPDTKDQDTYRWTESKILWNTVTLNAPDQLRHRVAWALASIFVVSETDIGHDHVVEAWGAYYDIFVRHAFASSDQSFFSLLKEVAFSPLMGKMLTFEESKSMSYHVERNGVSLFPDENFAREIMQLFSIGLYMLNEDGTQKLDANGDPIPTYTNEDIVNFSRGWTNFVTTPDDRDNVEPDWNMGWVPDRVDPMYLPNGSEARDFFPKQTLLVNGNRGYIGDRVPRCDALPDKMWLQKGARWDFRENSQSLLGKRDPAWWAEPESWTPRMILDPASNLYGKLCNPDGGGECNFQSTVILDFDVTCQGSCDAGPMTWNALKAPTMPCECDIDLPRTVRIDSPASAPVWFEYVPGECVQMAYPEPGNMNTVKEIGGSYGSEAMCADSRYAVAGATCCDDEGSPTDSDGQPYSMCVFKGERTTYQTAVDRCSAYNETGFQTCSWDSIPPNWSCGTDTAYYEGDYSVQKYPGMRFSWTSDACSMSAQVDQDGRVAIIHSVDSNTVKKRVGVDTGTYFGAFWTGSYPQASSGCAGGSSCQVEGTTCVCAAAVQTTLAFDGSMAPSESDLLSQLHIGAADPSVYGANHYVLCNVTACQNQSYKIYSRNAPASFSDAFDGETIFEVTDPDSGVPLFLSNTKSTVDLGGGFSFRNPPQYNSPVDPTSSSALHETNALLQNYAKHPNTAPFIATRLINHLISSNPSPRYVKAVADAFRSGSYSDVASGIDFGSGTYGDMNATVAAVLLDSEARSPTLDDDANHGRAREPLLKIIHMQRSLELSTSTGANREIDMIYLTDRGIGQEAFRSPSVFNFFLSEYSPVGKPLNKGLIAPETQLFAPPMLISFINGLFSLPVKGLSDCQWWQGFGDNKARWWLPDHPDSGTFDCYDSAAFASQGVPLNLNWKPPSWGGNTNVLGVAASAVIDDIDLLLTGGKLYSNSRTILEQVYNDALASGNDNDALKAVMQHYSAVPEFHVTNNLLSSGSTTQARPIPNVTLPTNPTPVTGYKGIVYLYLAGAADSYSMLVPSSGCSPLYDQYTSVRGDIALSWSRPIDAATSNQPCQSFGLHPSLVNVQNFYNQGDAAWVANVGPLAEALDAAEFDAGTKPVPQALFAHNTQTTITQAVFTEADAGAGGVLGRIGDALNMQAGEEVFAAYSISGTPKILDGAPGVSRPADVLSGGGVSSFNDLVKPWNTPATQTNIMALSANIATSIYAETFSASMSNALNRMDLLADEIDDTTLANEGCFDGLVAADEDNDIARQLKQVATLMKNRDKFQAHRDAFFTQIGGFDTHSDNGGTLTTLLTRIDDALGCFKLEMESQGIWNNVTVISGSEFSRTLTSNGQGTDHAWGGNHFIIGGSVKGGVIHGDYPDDLTENGNLNIGRGRLIPSTSWEGVWKGLAEWFGVASQDITTVLPNLPNFQTNVFSEVDLFE